LKCQSERVGEYRGAGGGFSTHLLSHCFGSHNLVTSSGKNSKNLSTSRIPYSRKEREWWWSSLCSYRGFL
jgi:hypothetical protein